MSRQQETSDVESRKTYPMSPDCLQCAKKKNLCRSQKAACATGQKTATAIPDYAHQSAP